MNIGIWDGENWELEQKAHWKKQEAIAREERRAVRRKKRRRKMWGDLFLTFLFVLGCLGIGYWAIGQQGEGGNGQSIFVQALAGQDLSGEETDALLLVNRWNPLPEGYVPDLVEVPGGEKVAKEAYAPLMEMLQQAEAEGLGPRWFPAGAPRKSSRVCMTIRSENIFPRDIPKRMLWPLRKSG